MYSKYSKKLLEHKHAFLLDQTELLKMKINQIANRLASQSFDFSRWIFINEIFLV